MKAFGIVAMAAALGAGVPATAQEEPVLIELFTSQGCAACPPADALLSELAARDDVVALALHVDYWDYIGWKDAFASPVFTARQRGYARAAGAHMVYTPQMIVEGMDPIVGYRPMEVVDLIEKHRSQPDPVTLSADRSGTTVKIDLSPKAGSDPVGPVLVQIATYAPERTVKIDKGENAGREITYSNIVTSWKVLGEWDGATPLTLTADLAEDQPAVVVVQRKGHGRVLAVERAD
ncbi:MAG: DUF1223 domain-containing protein [Tranquillimonas sp.]|jgi:hypothetical protein